MKGPWRFVAWVVVVGLLADTPWQALLALLLLLGLDDRLWS